MQKKKKKNDITALGAKLLRLQLEDPTDNMEFITHDGRNTLCKMALPVEHSGERTNMSSTAVGQGTWGRMTGEGLS